MTDESAVPQHPPADVKIPASVLEKSARIVPGTSEWRLQVAALAQKFFCLEHSETAAAWIGKTITPNLVDPWAVIDFLHYLTVIGVRSSGGGEDITRLLTAMERSGLIVPAGWHPEVNLLGQQYISQDAPTSQKNGEGVLWLSEVLGAELIIPTYRRATALIYGMDADGNPSGSAGTGLVLDSTRLLTNKHVIEGAGAGGCIGISGISSTRDSGSLQLGVKIHPYVDIAIIESADEVFTPIDGMVFRDPEWSDEVYVFGYPPVPMIAGTVLTVQRGEVVAPEAELPAIDGRAREKTFLYSAIARPGNSGGPIVAHDGRVIGLVVDDSSSSTRASAAGYEEPRPRWLWERIDHLEREVSELKTKVAAPAFYRGIPASEIMRALTDFDCRGSALFEGVDPPDPGDGRIATVRYEL